MGQTVHSSSLPHLCIPRPLLARGIENAYDSTIFLTFIYIAIASSTDFRISASYEFHRYSGSVNAFVCCCTLRSEQVARWMCTVLWRRIGERHWFLPTIAANWPGLLYTNGKICFVGESGGIDSRPISTQCILPFSTGRHRWGVCSVYHNYFWIQWFISWDSILTVGKVMLGEREGYWLLHILLENLSPSRITEVLWCVSWHSLDELGVPLNLTRHITPSNTIYCIVCNVLASVTCHHM